VHRDRAGHPGPHPRRPAAGGRADPRTSRGRSGDAAVMTAVLATVEPTAPAPGHHSHRARRICIDSGQEPVIYLHRQSAVCRSEGFESETRVSVTLGPRAILATLNVVTGPFLSVE